MRVVRTGLPGRYLAYRHRPADTGVRSFPECQTYLLDLLQRDSVWVEAVRIRPIDLRVETRRGHVQHHVIAGTEGPAAGQRSVLNSLADEIGRCGVQPQALGHAPPQE